MAHIAGKTFVASDRVFAMDEGNENFEMSAPVGAVTGLVSVGRLDFPDFRAWVATSDGNIAFFQTSDLNVPPRLVHVTDLPVLWSLYHAAGVLYLGTGDFSAPGPFALIAIDDQTFVPRWQVALPGPTLYPAGVGYQGNVPKQVVVASGNPNAAVRAFEVATGAELWSAPDSAFGQRVHDEVVYYGNLNDNTLRARSAVDGTLLWAFKNRRDFNFQTPVAAGGVVWASTAGNQVFALRASDGQVIWEVELGGHPGRPALIFDHPQGLSLVAVAEQDGGFPGFLQGIDANTGRRLWTSNVPVSQAGWSCSDPIAFATYGGIEVQVGTFDGTLMAFNGFDGQLGWQRQLNPGSAIFAKPRWVDF